MNIFEIVMVPIFVILLVVIFKPIKSAFNLDTFPSCVLSVCISALCLIAMRHLLNGSMEAILLPYAALAIAILLMSIFSFIGKHFNGTKDRLSDHTIRKDDAAKTDNKGLKRCRNDHRK